VEKGGPLSLRKQNANGYEKARERSAGEGKEMLASGKKEAVVTAKSSARMLKS